MRTALLTSCDDPGSMAAAAASGADAVVFDLSGPPARRPARRAAALAALLQSTDAPGSPCRVIRLAALSSGLVDADLDAIMAGAPDAVLLPQAVGPSAVEQLSAKLAVREAELRVEIGRTRIVAAPADTGAGLLALAGLERARSRLAALLWTPVALAEDLGAAGPDREPCRIARTMVLAAAAACGVPAFEAGPDEDDGALARRGTEARRDGFTGLVVHRLRQVALVRHGVVSPRAAPAR